MKLYETSLNASATMRCKATIQSRRNNQLIRAALAETGLKQWQLADILQMREDVLSRQLRYELPLERQKEIVAVIRKAVKHD